MDLSSYQNAAQGQMAAAQPQPAADPAAVASMLRRPASTMAAGPQMQGNPDPRTLAPMGQPYQPSMPQPQPMVKPAPAPALSAPIALGRPGGKNTKAPGGFGSAAPAPGRGKSGVPSQFRSLR